MEENWGANMSDEFIIIIGWRKQASDSELGRGRTGVKEQDAHVRKEEEGRSQ